MTYFTNTFGSPCCFKYYIEMIYTYYYYYYYWLKENLSMSKKRRVERSRKEARAYWDFSTLISYMT